MDYKIVLYIGSWIIRLNQKMSEREDAFIAFNVTQKIKERVETRAKQIGLNTSNYMRFLVMKDLNEIEKKA